MGWVTVGLGGVLVVWLAGWVCGFVSVWRWVWVATNMPLLKGCPRARGRHAHARTLASGRSWGGRHVPLPGGLRVCARVFMSVGMCVFKCVGGCVCARERVRMC